MTARPNAEAINDRAKLIPLRLTARGRRRRPELREEARAVVRTWLASDPESSFAPRWSAPLDLGLQELTRRLVARDEIMTELRNSSPFGRVAGLGLTDVDMRRRVWRMAKTSPERAPSERSTTSSAP